MSPGIVGRLVDGPCQGKHSNAYWLGNYRHGAVAKDSRILVRLTKALFFKESRERVFLDGNIRPTPGDRVVAVTVPSPRQRR